VGSASAVFQAQADGVDRLDDIVMHVFSNPLSLFDIGPKLFLASSAVVYRSFAGPAQGEQREADCNHECPTQGGRPTAQHLNPVPSSRFGKHLDVCWRTEPENRLAGWRVRRFRGLAHPGKAKAHPAPQPCGKARFRIAEEGCPGLV
jgi:hypothetical protein